MADVAQIDGINGAARLRLSDEDHPGGTERGVA